MLLYIIRHADPIYNPDTLTPKGKMQAQALAKRLAVHGLDKIYSSPMGRALETASFTGDLLGLPVNIEDWTQEVADRFTLTMPDGSTKFAVDVDNTLYRSDDNLNLGADWHTAEIFSSINIRDEYQKICDKSDEFLARHGYTRENGVYKITCANDDRVAVFCHGGFISVWLSHLLNIPLHIFIAGIGINHTGVTVVEFANRDNGYTAPYCLGISDISHIYKEDLPFKFTNYIDI